MDWSRRQLFAAAGLLWAGRTLSAARPVAWMGVDHYVVELDLRRLRVELVGRADPTLRDLDAAQAWLAASGRQAVALTNIGIFAPGEVPSGLCVEAGKEWRPLNTRTGAGNFFLRPNGVLGAGPAGALIRETGEWAAAPPTVDWATQSGPLLVRGGGIHPAFQPDSTNRRLRSGAGLRDPWILVLAISDGRVRFHDFATLFRDALSCPDALYLDGEISALRAPGVPERLGVGIPYSGLLVASTPTLEATEAGG